MEREARQNSEMLTAADRTNYYTTVEGTNYQMTVRDQVMRISNTHAITVMLPAVAEAAGMTFDISVDSSTAAITLTAHGGPSYEDAQDWVADYTLDAAEDRIMLRSDGLSWYVVENVIS